MAFVAARNFPRLPLIVCLGLFACVTGWSAIAAAAVDNDPIAPVRAPFPIPQFSRPTFPDRVFNIRDYGAVADGSTKNTAAIERAIAACADAGGGRVLVPAGRWFSGPIHLRSKIDLHLAEGAEVIFSDHPEDYMPVVLVRVGGVELYNYSPFIYARDCVDVAITGPGRLNGNAAAWRSWQKHETSEIFKLALQGIPVEQRIFGTPEAAIRPNFVVLMNCRHVLLEGFTIGNGANWTIQPVYCENVLIRRVSVITDGPNNDGIDPDSCRNVLIEHCTFDTGDDCVVLKSGYNEDGWRVARPMENLVMRWCSSKRGHGGLVIGSETSGDVRNVYVHDCNFEGTDRAVRIKSKRGRGGIVENVWAENLTVRDLKHEVVIMNMGYGADRNQTATERPPRFRNFHFRNLSGRGATAAVLLQGLPDSPIEAVSFDHLNITSHRGIIATDVKGLAFANVNVTPEQGPVFELNQASFVTIRGATIPPEHDAVFLKLSGKDSSAVYVERGGLDSTVFKSVIGKEVQADALIIR
ncbi:MAG TPA: glycoside hydrolase family 28 protein [Lacunisphaera sp.]|jgi:hypothetical protein